MTTATLTGLKTIGIIGSGTMGNGIAQVAAQSGYRTIMVDIAESALANAMSGITRSLEKLVVKAKMTTDQKEETLGNLSTSTDYHQIMDCDLVIEAALENKDVKRKIFEQLSALVREDCILASNTSTISITEIASYVTNPGRVIGMHFMNPVPIMQLVEVIRAMQTTDDTYQVVQALAEKMGKTPVEVNDSPGFVSNRVLLPMINEAINCLYEGVGKPEAIDLVLKLGMNHPMGPLALADLIGLDVCLSILNVLYTDFADSKYRPSPLLKKMVAAGYLGRKTGKGFFEYA